MVFDPNQDLPAAPPQMEELVAKASPGADFAASQVLANLESKLFNRRRDPVHVGRYIIERRLGSGGSSTVYCAYDPQKDRRVALKLLHPGEGARQAAAQARLFREAQTLAKIDHPNVVKIYDVGTYDSSVFEPAGPAKRSGEPGVYVAMELIDGMTLDSWLRVRPRTWREIRDVFVKAAWGLAAAHAKGLIHRDFKPANVLVSVGANDAAERVVVLDFGLARATDKLASSSHFGLGEAAKEHLKKAAAPIDATLTAPGTLLGTPAYMAPEQHARGRGTALSDQYSLCLALYEAWYGHRPFFAETERALEEAKFAGDVMPPPADTDVPPHLFNAVLKGMSAAPEERFATIQKLIEVLTTEPKSYAVYWAVAGAIVIVASVATFLAWPTHPCSDGAEPLAGVWDEDVEAKVGEALRGVDVAYAESTAELAAASLDAHAEAWGAAWTEACEAEPDRDPGPDRTCLGTRRAVLAGVTAGLGEVDAESIEPAVVAAATLPDPSVCLRSPAPWFFAPEASEATRSALAATEADALLERWPAAVEHGSEAVESAKAGDDPHANTVAALRLAEAQASAGELTAAIDGLADVLWSASGEHGTAIARAAATRLVELSPKLPQPHADAPLWAQRARDTTAKGPAMIRSRALVALGRALVAEGQAARGLEDLAVADELLRPLANEPTPLHVQAATALGEALLAQGKTGEAVERLHQAATHARAVYGPSHPRTGAARAALARAYQADGKLDEAKTEKAEAAETLGAQPEGG